MRLYWIYLLALVVLLLTIYLLRPSFQLKNGAGQLNEYMLSAKLQSYDKYGNLEQLIDASFWEFDAKAAVSHIQHPQFLNKDWRIEAEVAKIFHSKFNKDIDVINLQGSVRAKMLKKQNLTLETIAMQYLPRQNKIISAEHVIILQDELKIEGDGLTINLTENTMELHKNVQSRIYNIKL